MDGYKNIFWFRRDLRFYDNHGLMEALRSSNRVHAVFIFDINILQDLSADDLRVSFIKSQVRYLDIELTKIGSGLSIFYGDPVTIFERFSHDPEIMDVYANRDYEPYAVQRDQKIREIFQKAGKNFFDFDDHVLMAPQVIVKPDGKPYTVFTAYSKIWKQSISENRLSEYKIDSLLTNFDKRGLWNKHSFVEKDFQSTSIMDDKPVIDLHRIINYHKYRDYPAIEGTTRLGIHLRFGTISIRHLVAIAIQNNDVFLNELIWRDFYQMILYHYPHVVTGSFKKVYDRIEWINNQSHFEAWCEGKTGYPLVDAGMRQLNQTGFMHNRVRMVTASFLTKHLLIDWRWGEAYFALKLLDYDLAANNGGWQWAAGTGNDAAPYFRVFNPELQQKRYDPEFKYVRRWVPEYGVKNLYPKPIVEHNFARTRALTTYKNALQQ